MATRIELPKAIIQTAFKQRLQSLSRAQKEATNELIKTALADELSLVQTALNTMVELPLEKTR